MEQTQELFLSGFCKAQGQTRTVMCEIAMDPDGTGRVLDTDCAYPDCPHSGDCVIYRDISQGTAL